MLLLLELVINLLDEVFTIPVASACDYLNVFRINALAIHYFNYSNNSAVVAVSAAKRPCKPRTFSGLVGRQSEGRGILQHGANLHEAWAYTFTRMNCFNGTGRYTSSLLCITKSPK